MTAEQIFPHLDHTLLKATATWPEIQRICEESVRWGMASACIPPAFVQKARQEGPETLRLCTVVGFPLGYTTTAAKVYETRQALQDGADEIDMVIHLGDVKSGRFDAITREIAALKELAGEKCLKVIVEACALTDAEKIALCGCVTTAGADFIKTSTGFGPSGATLEDVRLFRQHVGPGVQVKAAGGIRTKEAMEAFLAAGAARIGTSNAAVLWE